MINRNNEKIVPSGNTVLQVDDEVLIGTTVVKTPDDINLCETYIDKTHQWLNKKLSELNCPNNFLVALIKRDGSHFVPNGDTEILFGDTVIFYEV